MKSRLKGIGIFFVLESICTVLSIVVSNFDTVEPLTGQDMWNFITGFPYFLICWPLFIFGDRGGLLGWPVWGPLDAIGIPNALGWSLIIIIHGSIFYLTLCLMSVRNRKFQAKVP